MSSVIGAIRTWGEMVKFSHSIFALPFALIAAFLAGRHIEGRGWPHWGQLGLVVLCMVAARSLAMTFNRIVDAALDARNPRTADRPLPAGRISRAAAWAMFLLAMITFGLGCLGFFVLYGNPWPILLSGPVMLYLCVYSFTKRFTRWSHFVLGSAIALSPVAAWLAVHPQSIGAEAVLLLVAVMCWIAGFDIIYACLDVDFDRETGLHSLPARLGVGRALWIARLAHLITASAWTALGFLVPQLTWLYGLAVLIGIALLTAENALVRPGDLRRVNLAFFTLNGVASVVFATLTLMDLLL